MKFTDIVLASIALATLAEAQWVKRRLDAVEEDSDDLEERSSSLQRGRGRRNNVNGVQGGSGDQWEAMRARIAEKWGLAVADEEDEADDVEDDAVVEVVDVLNGELVALGSSELDLEDESDDESDDQEEYVQRRWQRSNRFQQNDKLEKRRMMISRGSYGFAPRRQNNLIINGGVKPNTNRRMLSFQRALQQYGSDVDRQDIAEFQQARREYLETMPQKSDYLGEDWAEGLRAARESYGGRGPYWRSDEYQESEYALAKEAYRQAMSDWREGMPTWESW